MLPRQMQGWLLLLQCGAVPLPQLRRSVVGALRKIDQDCVGTFDRAHCVVWQAELAQLGLIEGSVRLNLRFCESRWLRICIGIKNWCWRGGIARPETKAAYLLRVGLTRNRIR